jgi:hypothetical protein
MGIDTRYWGPSGWQLFHYIAEHASRPEPVLQQMHRVLPCKFCRDSTSKFVHDHPLKGDPVQWVYEIHNMVNDKLRTQCKDDAAVVDPGPDPTLEDVRRKYQSMKLTNVLGRDFLFAVAMNYPDAPTPEERATQEAFMRALSDAYPVKGLFKDPELASRNTYSKWMYAQLKSKRSMPSYKGYVQRLRYYESGCEKKTYRGKTCRRTKRSRDHKRTHRIVQSILLA